MNWRVNAHGRALGLALAAQHPAVIGDFHQAASRHLGPMQSEGDLVVAVVAARHRQSEVVEDALAEPVLDRQTVRRREIDARLLLRLGDFVLVGSRRYQSHLRLRR